ncbi:MAG: hypothetical protein IT376_04370 [Polyangiaceae bacterium]|nr:hypothetical protein [Polyangiaceae bacterium]
MALLAAVVLAVVRVASASPVIPPGQDAVLGALVGAGQPDVGGCRLVSADAEKVRIEATYDCAGARVGVVLHHRSAAVEALAESEQFRVATAPGSAPPPPALVAGVLERVRQHEQRFRWLGADSGERLSAPPPAHVPPSLLVGGLGLLALLAGGGVAARRRGRLAARAGEAAVVAALVTAIGWLRWRLVPHTFFHQNGQGPLWVDYVVGGSEGGGYGPGQAELFAYPARAVPGEPEAGIFVAQAALGALALLGVWVACRARGARPLLAAAAVGFVGADPWLARATQSESYFGSCTSLLFLAAAALAVGSARPRWRTPGFAVAVVTAGALAAHAAKIHPVAWVPAAHLPLVVLAGRGRARSRVVAALVAALGVGLVTAGFAHDTLTSVLGGRAGAQWLPQLSGSVTALAIRGAWFVGGAGLVLALARGAQQVRLLAVVGLAAAIGSAAAARYVGAPAAWVDAAQPRTFLPHLVVVAALAVALARVRWRWLRRPWLAPGALALAGVASGAWSLRPARELPTDVLEAEWVRSIRRELPSRARVVYLGRAGQRVLFLSLHGAATGGARSHVMTAGPEQGLPGSGELFYLRSSLCSTPEGSAACAELERRLTLQPLRDARFPARPSMVWFRYLEPEVSVALFAAAAR